MLLDKKSKRQLSPVHLKPQEKFSVRCSVCWELAIQPLECRQCHNLVCATCEPKIDSKCPICRTENQLDYSKEAKKRVCNLKIMCQRDCGVQVKIE